MDLGSLDSDDETPVVQDSTVNVPPPLSVPEIDLGGIAAGLERFESHCKQQIELFKGPCLFELKVQII